MKLENTLENKTRFFAQYLNQQVFYRDRIGNIVSFYLSCGNFTKQVWIVLLEDENFEKNELSCEANINECQLILKPLSHISDEDVIQGIMITYNKTYEDLGEILEVKHYDTFSSITTTRAGENFKTFRSFHHWNGNRKIGSMECDYLRSKGYALPWMDLSVEDLIEYGWVKLKEN